MSTLGIVLVVILFLVLVGGAGPHIRAPWGVGYGSGYVGFGGIGLILLIVLLLAFLGRI